MTLGFKPGWLGTYCRSIRQGEIPRCLIEQRDNGPNPHEGPPPLDLAIAYIYGHPTIDTKIIDTPSASPQYSSTAPASI